MPLPPATDVGACTTNCHTAFKMMMHALASVYPGSDVPAEAAFAAEESLRQCLDACHDMYPPEGG